MSEPVEGHKLHGPYLGVRSVMVSHLIPALLVEEKDGENGEVHIIVTGDTRYVWVDPYQGVLFVNRAHVDEEPVHGSVTVTDNAQVAVVTAVNTGTMTMNYTDGVATVKVKPAQTYRVLIIRPKGMKVDRSVPA